MAVASSVDSTPRELAFVAQSFDVHDAVLGEFLSRKTPLYNLYDRFHCCRHSHMLQWNWKLLVLPGVQYVAESNLYSRISFIWLLFRACHAKITRRGVDDRWITHVLFSAVCSVQTTTASNVWDQMAILLWRIIWQDLFLYHLRFSLVYIKRELRTDLWYIKSGFYLEFTVVHL